VEIDIVLYFEQLTVTPLRNVIGSMDLEKTLTSRATINSQLRGVLDEATGKSVLIVDHLGDRVSTTVELSTDRVERGECLAPGPRRVRPRPAERGAQAAPATVTTRAAPSAPHAITAFQDHGRVAQTLDHDIHTAGARSARSPTRDSSGWKARCDRAE
jgi:hypothetical protein